MYVQNNLVWRAGLNSLKDQNRLAGYRLKTSALILQNQNGTLIIDAISIYSST